MSMVERAIEREKRSAAARFVRAVRAADHDSQHWALSVAKFTAGGHWRWALRHAFLMGFFLSNRGGSEETALKIADVLAKFGEEVQRIDEKALHPPMM